jgi:hypothetical protein
MKAIRVNADYESVLFEKKELPQIINQSIEFSALFLEERKLFSSKKYLPSYLEYVEKISGVKPQVVHTGDYENWWGSLSNLELERTINSKEICLNFSTDTQLITSPEELRLEAGTPYLAKNPFGMSGQNFIVFKKGEEHKLPVKNLVVEPLFNRVNDFSHYVLPKGERICYKNIVDHKFHYKGSVFCDLSQPTLESLPFYKEISSKEREKFSYEFENICQFLSLRGVQEGYSIDSFSYVSNNQKILRTLSEVNYRKTMGLVTWLLAKKYCGKNNWAMMIIGKKLKMLNSFDYIQKMIDSISWKADSQIGCLQLSPGDTRFEVFFLSAQSCREGDTLYQKLINLLPDCQFPVNI